jgi:DNA polymerase-3 subunit beta
MNDQPNPAEFALAMYATACESHMRRDWREACHALAKALKAEQLASASRATLATAAPAPEPVATAPASPVKAKPAARATRVAKGAESFDMMAGSLARALRLVCRAVEKRSNDQPILDNALIEARGDSVLISGTNMDRVISVQVEAPGVGEWTATAGAHALLAMLAKADKAAPVTLAIAGKGSPLTVTIGGAVRSLPTLAPDRWPEFLPDSKWAPVDVDGAALISALAFIAPAMSTEETRYYLNGAFLGVRVANGERRLHVVATDGHRLHKADIDAPTCDALDLATSTDEMGREYSSRGAILPRDSVRDLLALAGDGAGLTFALAGDKGYQVTRGAVTLTSRLVDGSFPDYMRIIPNGSNFTVTADRLDLASKVAGVASVSKEKSRAVRFSAEGHALALRCKNMEGGTADDVLEVDYRDTGDAATTAREWGMNELYVREALASLDGAVVTFAGADPASPFLVTGADDSRLAVLMPLRV